MTQIANRRSRSPKDAEMLVVIGKEIKSLRESNGMTIAEFVENLKATFGHVTGFNAASIAKAEAGTRALSPYRLLCIAIHFNVPMSKLLGPEALDREHHALNEYYDA